MQLLFGLAIKVAEASQPCIKFVVCQYLEEALDPSGITFSMVFMYVLMNSISPSETSPAETPFIAIVVATV